MDDKQLFVEGDTADRHIILNRVMDELALICRTLDSKGVSYLTIGTHLSQLIDERAQTARRAP